MNRLEPREDARLNRKRIVEAAREVFRERGVAAEMREIAERAGLAVGTIYRNYPSKDDLIIALLDDALVDITSDGGGASADPVEELQALLSKTITLADRYGWLMEAYLGRQISERCREELERNSQKLDFASRYGGLLRRGIETGQLRRALDIDSTTSLLLGASSPWVCRPLLDKETPAEIAARLIKTLLGGIGAEAREQTGRA